MLLDISLSLWQTLLVKRPNTQLILPALCRTSCKVHVYASPQLYVVGKNGIFVDSGCSVGGAQNAEALFRQAQSGTQQAGRQAYQQAFSSDNEATFQQGDYAQEAASLPAAKPVHGRMLTFVSDGGKAVLSSSVALGNPSSTAKRTHLQTALKSHGMFIYVQAWNSSHTGLCLDLQLSFCITCECTPHM